MTYEVVNLDAVIADGSTRSSRRSSTNDDSVPDSSPSSDSARTTVTGVNPKQVACRPEPSVVSSVGSYAPTLANRTTAEETANSANNNSKSGGFSSMASYAPTWRPLPPSLARTKRRPNYSI